MGTYEALLWLCEWNLGEQRGKRAKGEQTGTLNRVFFTDLRPFSRIRGLFRNSGPFRGFGAFSGIRDLFRGFPAFFGDPWICGLFADLRPFPGFAAFFADSRPFHRFAAFFEDSRPFRRFVAFSWIRGLFTDSLIHRQGSEGSERATWRNFRYLIFGLCHDLLISLNSVKAIRVNSIVFSQRGGFLL